MAMELRTGDFLCLLRLTVVGLRDLKLDNVVLTEDGHVKLIDFGMSKDRLMEDATTDTICGTPSSMAPEIIKREPYGKAVDWWALGVMIYEMCVGCAPFEGDTEDELFNAILEREYSVPHIVSEPTKNIIAQVITDLLP